MRNIAELVSGFDLDGTIRREIAGSVVEMVDTHVYGNGDRHSDADAQASQIRFTG